MKQLIATYLISGVLLRNAEYHIAASIILVYELFCKLFIDIPLLVNLPGDKLPRSGFVQQFCGPNQKTTGIPTSSWDGRLVD